MSHEVFINRVRYVPAKDVQPTNARAIKLALLEIFWGNCSSDSDEELDRKCSDLFISVVEVEPNSSYWSIEDFVSRTGELS